MDRHNGSGRPGRALRIYTDGACSGNPGPGGWAYVATVGGQALAQGFGHEDATTNQRMETRAACEALEAASVWNLCGDDSVEIVTDSAVLHGQMALGWKRNANGDLLRRLDGAIAALPCPVTFSKVRGHSGDPMNGRADRLAVQAAKSAAPSAGRADPSLKEREGDGDAEEKARVSRLELDLEGRTARAILSDGTAVTIWGAYGGFVQGDAARERLTTTLPYAEALSGWLNGGPLPGMREGDM